MGVSSSSSSSSSSSYFYSYVLLALLSVSTSLNLVCEADPTDGFTLVPLTNHNIVLQKPYNKPLQDRYSDVDGTRRLWVYTNDKPFKASSGTRPRTKVRINGLDYSSGVWQFEGYAYVPRGTSGVTIMQIPGARVGATTLQLRIYNGVMKYYKFDVIATNLYNKWFRLNVIHNVDEGKVTVFIDGVQKYVVKDQIRGPETCTSNVEFMLPQLVQVTTWNRDGNILKFTRNDDKNTSHIVQDKEKEQKMNCMI